jgi:hypothetical protein
LVNNDRAESLTAWCPSVEFANDFSAPRIRGTRPLRDFTEGAAASNAQPLRIEAADVDAGRRHRGLP